jgi:hypothetical protein
MLDSAHDGSVPYAPRTPFMRIDIRTRHPRGSLPLLGRPVPSPWRREILDDSLLGSAWRWDADDDRSASAR